MRRVHLLFILYMCSFCTGWDYTIVSPSLAASLGLLLVFAEPMLSSSLPLDYVYANWPDRNGGENGYTGNSPETSSDSKSHTVYLVWWVNIFYNN